MFAFVQAHPAWSTLGACWLYSALVDPMPAPTEKSGGFYRWLFGALHTLGGNLSKVSNAIGARQGL